MQAASQTMKHWKMISPQLLRANLYLHLSVLPGIYNIYIVKFIGIGREIAGPSDDLIEAVFTNVIMKASALSWWATDANNYSCHPPKITLIYQFIHAFIYWSLCTLLKLHGHSRQLGPFIKDFCDKITRWWHSRKGQPTRFLVRAIGKENPISSPFPPFL